MTLEGWALIALFVLIITAIARPIGLFLAAVYEGRRTLLSPVLAPVGRAFYAAAGVSADHEQNWRGYAGALVTFSLASTLLLFVILRFQNHLPINPQGFEGVPSGVAMNTAISFVTNTNGQAYAGESTMSHFSQMAGLTVQNFVSAARYPGQACVCLVRARTIRRSGRGATRFQRDALCLYIRRRQQWIGLCGPHGERRLLHLRPGRGDVDRALPGDRSSAGDCWKPRCKAHRAALALIPLALKGVAWRTAPAGRLLARNLAIYGVGVLVAPFIGIKLIDLVITSLNLA